MIIYRTSAGMFVEEEKAIYLLRGLFDEFVCHEDPRAYLASRIDRTARIPLLPGTDFFAPIGNQEVWAAGVTYFRSRVARIEESKDAGGKDFYDRVYAAERPELFFKSLGYKVAGHRSHVRLRSDAVWSVPEPELALLVSPRGDILGYTIGNDMSSRDIEGENPLYLPQAKVYDRSCALGPGVLVQREPLPPSTEISIEIQREGKSQFKSSTTLAEMKRTPQVLIEYLFRDQVFPYGCFILTGTGIVPPDSFTLHHGDAISITIEAIGTLTNIVS